MARRVLTALAAVVAAKATVVAVAGREVGKGDTMTKREKEVTATAALEAAATGEGDTPLKTAVRASAAVAKEKGSSSGGAAVAKAATTTTPTATEVDQSAGGGAATVAARPAAGGPTAAVVVAERPTGGTRWRTRGLRRAFSWPTTCLTRPATKSTTRSGAEGAATSHRAKTVDAHF